MLPSEQGVEAGLPPFAELAQRPLEGVVTDRDLVVKGPGQPVPHGIGGAPDVGRSPHQAVEDDEEAVAHPSITTEPNDPPTDLSTAPERAGNLSR